MKKQIKKFSNRLALVLCCTTLMSNIPVIASSEGMEGTLIEPANTAMESTLDEMLTETEVDSIVEQKSVEIIVQGLDGIQLEKIEYTGRSTGSCQGLFHNWQVTQTIQEQTCGQQGIWRINCIDCGISATTFSDINDHNYVNETCTNCGDTTIEIAPEGELDNWNYTLNEAASTITLDQYTGSSTDVIVYGMYKINGIQYSTILNGNGILSRAPFYSKRSSLMSIKVNSGVISYNCTNLFNGCTNLTSIDLSSFDTSNVTTMGSMFFRCSNLTSLDLSSFDTSNVTTISYMFYLCGNLTSLDLSSFDTSNVTTMSSMFDGCSNLTSLDLSSFDTSNVTDMGSTFDGCSNLTSLDLSSFDTSKVTTMKCMFDGCGNLTSLDLSSFDTSNVTDMSYMFYGCSNLISLDLSSFDTSKVYTMKYMFDECSSLTSLDLSSFNTSYVSTMDFMFYGCNNLTSIDLSSFDTIHVDNMIGMFRECSNLTSLDLSSFNTSHVDDMTWMFYSCRNLSTIYVGAKWNTSSASTWYMFTDCGTSSVTLKE